MNWRHATSDIFKSLSNKQRIGLFTDMDGTVSPIVSDPDSARITDKNRELLQLLADQLTVVGVISGRSARDIYERINLPGLIYIGNHGLEQWVDGKLIRSSDVDSYRLNIESACADLQAVAVDGIRVENKQATLSVHYRQSHNPEVVQAQLRKHINHIANTHDLRIFEGRMIFELRPPIDINKGSALEKLVSEYQLDYAIYLGDDTTDVDALRMARHLRNSDQCYCIGIGVKSSDVPIEVIESSDFSVSGISDVEDFFAWLLSATSESSS